MCVFPYTLIQGESKQPLVTNQRYCDFFYVEQSERENIIQRQSGDIAATRMRLRRLGRLIKPVPTEFVPFYHKWKNKETKPCQGGTGAWGAAKFHFYRLARRLKARETKENEEYQLL